MHVLRSCMFMSVLLLASCSGPRSAKEPAVITQEVMLDPVEVVASRSAGKESNEVPVYRASERRLVDIVHMDLDLAFDWENQSVMGRADVILQPHFLDLTTVTLDAHQFDLHAVTAGNGADTLDWTYDGKALNIRLDQPLTRRQGPFTVRIDYTAHPARGARQKRRAITSDQGLYFIDPLDEDDALPSQIWTQGETAHNSRWFPTIDHPNEKMTHRITLTVRDTFETLSNGILTSSIANPDGTRTDTWVMDQPHAPYLVMIAVGDYAVERDIWKGVPVEYYVEPLYASSARMIFNHTVEMLEFFSQRLGYRYPWKKYAQVVVRNFVSGAMENTTAVVYGDFVQDHADHFLTGRENDYIVAHELIHHWFGDLVTCESWANLALNEGFANYGEYLWFEHKYGVDEADYHRISELKGYYSQAAYDMHPLIRFQYDEADEMFDAHSYNKGGLVLHMLRDYLGDKVFFESLRRYLARHAYQTVEVHDLRLAFEEVSGEDLNWFFNQWFLSPGHPVLEFTSRMETAGNTFMLDLSQVQDPERSAPVFRLPIKIDLMYADGSSERKQVWMEKREQTYSFPVKEKPALVLLDTEDDLLLRLRHPLGIEESRIQLEYAPSLRHRTEALYHLIREEAVDETVFLVATADPHWSVRSAAIDAHDSPPGEAGVQRLLDLAMHDRHPRVRLDALEALAAMQHPEAAGIAEKWLAESRKTEIVFTCLQVLVEADMEKARQVIEKMDLPLNEALQIGKAMIYSADGRPGDAPFFTTRISLINQYLEPYLEQYFIFFSKQEKTLAQAGIRAVVDYVGSSKPPFQRYIALRELVGFLDLLRAGKSFKRLSKNDREALYREAADSLFAQIRKEKDVRWKTYMDDLVRDLGSK